jgi:hypothetical protein
MLMDQLRNLNVPGPAPRQHKRRSNPLGALQDLFKKRR